MNKIYKIKEGFVVRKIGDSYVVVAVGKRSKDFHGVITLNETGAFLFEKLIEGRTKEDLIKDLLAEYDVTEENANKDVDNFLNNLIKGDLIL